MYTNYYFTPNKSFLPTDSQGLYKTTKFMPYSFPYMSQIDSSTNVDRYSTPLYKQSLSGPIYPTTSIRCPFALPSEGPKTKLISLPNIPKYTIKDYLIENHPLFLQKIRIDETLEKQTEFEAVKLILEKQKEENIRLYEIEKEYTDNMKKVNQNLIEKIKKLSDENDELSLERLKLKRECERIKYEYDKEMYLLLHKKKPKLEPEHFEHFVIPEDEEESVKEEVKIEEPKIDIFEHKPEVKKPEPVKEPVKADPSKELQIELNTDGHKYGIIEQYKQKKLQKKYAHMSDKVDAIKFSKGVNKDKVYLDMYDNKLSVPVVNSNTSNIVNKAIKNSQNDINNKNNVLYRQDSHPKYEGQIQENVNLDKLNKSKKIIKDKQAKNAEESKKKKYTNLNSEKITVVDREKVLKQVLNVILNNPNKSNNIYLDEYTKTEEHKDELNEIFDYIYKDLNNATKYDLNQLCMLVFEIINSNPDININFENILNNEEYNQNDFINDIQSDCEILLNTYIIPHFKTLIQNSDVDIGTASNFICKAILNFNIDNINDIIDKLIPIIQSILISS